MNRNLVLLTIISVLTFSGCTTRYSQSLAGSVPNEKGMEVDSTSHGFTLLFIKLNEPTSAGKQVMELMMENNCTRLNLVEIDYREMSFLLFSLPKVKITGTCVE